MADDRAMAPLLGGVALLERAISYALGALHGVCPADLSRPTPCHSWDLRTLIAHMHDSVGTLHDAVGSGQLEPELSTGYTRPAGDLSGDPVAALRVHTHRLLGTWATTRSTVSLVAGYPLTTGIVASTGALEIAIHGWDVGQTTGGPPIPDALAEELLPLARLLVSDADRPARFAAPVPVPPSAGSAERLLAFLGRSS